MRRHREAVALAQLQLADEAEARGGPAAAPESERDRRIADLMSALNVGGPPASAAQSEHTSPVRPYKPSLQAHQALQHVRLDSPSPSALSQATTAAGAKLVQTGECRPGHAYQHHAAAAVPGRLREARGARHRSSGKSGHGPRGHDAYRHGHEYRDAEEIEEDLDGEPDEQYYSGMEDSVTDATVPLQEDDPFDAAADAVLAAARSKQTRSRRPPPVNVEPASLLQGGGAPHAQHDLDATLGRTLEAETSMDLFHYAERQASNKLASASTVGAKLAHADMSLQARRTATPSGTTSSVASSSAARASARATSQPDEPFEYREPRAMPEKLSRPPTTSVSSSTATAPRCAALTTPTSGQAIPTAKPTAARLAGAKGEARRAASDAGMAGTRGVLAAAQLRRSEASDRPAREKAQRSLGPVGDAFEAAVSSRAVSRQQEQEHLMLERKLEASLDRLDAKLAQFRARRAANEDAETASCLSVASRGHSTVSAPPRAQSAAAVVQRLRTATREAAHHHGLYPDEPPCKRHGLVSCKLCEEEARNPMQRKPPKPSRPLPPPPPPRQVRSAQPGNRTQISSYVAARRPPLPKGAKEGKGTIARALQAARSEGQRQHQLPPRMPTPVATETSSVVAMERPPTFPYRLPMQLPMNMPSTEGARSLAAMPMPIGPCGWNHPPCALMGPGGASAPPGFPMHPTGFYGTPPGLAHAMGTAGMPQEISERYGDGGDRGASAPPSYEQHGVVGPGGTAVTVAPNAHALLFGDE